jgi:hypothetical protein
MWILADAFTNAMILSGVVLLALIVFRHFHRGYVERNLTPSGSKSEATKAASPASRPSEGSFGYMNWQVEMHELAASMKGELDSKMRLLQLLIGEARVEAERLEKLLAEFDARQPPKP